MRFNLPSVTLTNADVGELLALRSEELTGDRQRAYRRASRAAYKWPDEVSDLVAQERPLTELKGIGARLSGLIQSWLDESPEIPEPPPIRAGFRSYAEARADPRSASRLGRGRERRPSDALRGQ